MKYILTSLKMCGRILTTPKEQFNLLNQVVSGRGVLEIVFSFSASSLLRTLPLAYFYQLSTEVRTLLHRLTALLEGLNRRG